MTTLIKMKDAVVLHLLLFKTGHRTDIVGFEIVGNSTEAF